MGHLSKAERHRIEQHLRQQRTFQEIATALSRPRSTIMREVLKHRQESCKTSPGRIANRCVHRRNCDRMRLCPGRRSVHHILSTQRDLFTVCEKTVYRYINAGIIRTKRGDMPRSCMMRPRKNKIDHKVDTQCRIGRTFNDFKLFCRNNPDTPVVEMDSVAGRIGGKVLLTLQFNSCGFMMAFLRDANNSQTVIDIFNHLEKSLGETVFKKLFPVILTDNGSEFSNPTALEISPSTKKQRTQIFYCDPYASWQKGHVENNHLNLRKILSKGSSFDELTQQNIDLAVSHINSIARKSLNDVPAITLFETIYGREVLRKLHLALIPAKEVNLTQDLLK